MNNSYCDFFRISDKNLVEKGIAEIEAFANSARNHIQGASNEKETLLDHLSFHFGQEGGNIYTKFSFEYLCGLLSCTTPLRGNRRTHS